MITLLGSISNEIDALRLQAGKQGKGPNQYCGQLYEYSMETREEKNSWFVYLSLSPLFRPSSFFHRVSSPSVSNDIPSTVVPSVPMVPPTPLAGNRCKLGQSDLTRNEWTCLASARRRSFKFLTDIVYHHPLRIYMYMCICMYVFSCHLFIFIYLIPCLTI